MHRKRTQLLHRGAFQRHNHSPLSRPFRRVFIYRARASRAAAPTIPIPATAWLAAAGVDVGVTAASVAELRTLLAAPVALVSADPAAPVALVSAEPAAPVALVKAEPAAPVALVIADSAAPVALVKADPMAPVALVKAEPAAPVRESRAEVKVSPPTCSATARQRFVVAWEVSVIRSMSAYEHEIKFLFH